MTDSIFTMVENALLIQDRQRVIKLVLEGTRKGIPVEQLRNLLLNSLENLRHRMMTNSISLPEFLLFLEMIDGGLETLTALKKEEPSSSEPLVIGVVEGDPHDMGKNIITKLYRAAGYQVHDLGKEVPQEAFLNAVEAFRPKILALSAMMSTTMPAMKEIIKLVKLRYPKTVIMVGGAALDRKIAHQYGADGYAESALTCLDETDSAIQAVVGSP